MIRCTPAVVAVKVPCASSPMSDTTTGVRPIAANTDGAPLVHVGADVRTAKEDNHEAGNQDLDKRACIHDD
mgnify:CR=1 FL=1